MGINYIKHYVILGLYTNENAIKKIAFHIPTNSKNMDKKIVEFNAAFDKIRDNLLSGTYSFYTMGSPEESWKNLKKHNRYFIGTKKVDNVDEFIRLINNNSFGSVDVANYVGLVHTGKHKCTHLRVQKLVYFIYKKYLIDFDKKMFKGEFLKWKYGPVNFKIYKKFSKSINSKFEKKDYGFEMDVKGPNNKVAIEKDPIYNSYLKLSLNKEWKKIDQTIKEVVKKYENTSTYKLANLTHKENSAWSKADKNNKKSLSINDIKTCKY